MVETAAHTELVIVATVLMLSTAYQRRLVLFDNDVCTVPLPSELTPPATGPAAVDAPAIHERAGSLEASDRAVMLAMPPPVVVCAPPFI